MFKVTYLSSRLCFYIRIDRSSIYFRFVFIFDFVVMKVKVDYRPDVDMVLSYLVTLLICCNDLFLLLLLSGHEPCSF